MECGDPAPLCSAWPDARLLQEISLSPLAEPGLGNESGESSPHSKKLPIRFRPDPRWLAAYFPPTTVFVAGADTAGPIICTFSCDPRSGFLPNSIQSLSVWEGGGEGGIISDN
jgi:hypothetical protein